MTNTPEHQIGADYFNKHILNLKNIAAVSVNGDAKVSKNFSKLYNAQLQRSGLTGASEESARKSLELLQQVVQHLVNEKIDSILQQFIENFFEPAFLNIEKNCGRILDKEVMTTVICRRLLEEVISQKYPLSGEVVPDVAKIIAKKRATNSSTATGESLSTPNSAATASSTPRSHGELSPISSHEIGAEFSTQMLNSKDNFLRPALPNLNGPSTSNDSPATVAGRCLRSLKTRKRSFSDSDNINSPPRGCRAAAQRAVERVASNSSSSRLAGAASSEQQLFATSKKLRSDMVTTSFAKPPTVGSSSGTKSHSQLTITSKNS